jgi:exopolysaccharide biosynthesis polyprenyl glycosylphosphotransferase
MIRRHGELSRTTLLVGDTLAATVAACLAYALRFHSGLLAVEGELVVVRYLEALPVAVAGMVASCALAGTYERDRLGAAPRLADALRVGALTMLVLATLALFYWTSFQYSRLAIVIAGAFFSVTFPAGRAVTSRLLAGLRRSGALRTTVAVVGGGAPAAAFALVLEANPWMALDVVAVLPVGSDPAAWPRARRVEDVAEVGELVEAGAVREVFLAVPAEASSQLGGLLSALGHQTADVRVIPDLGDALLLNPDASVLSGLPVISLRERPLYGLRAAVKRGLDVSLALVLVVLALPFVLVVALAIKLSSRGPVLYRQRRTGLDGREFEMLKFRTMAADAERESGPVFARRGDPRTTAVGRFLRRFSLDELPQLANVLRGDMSLVGPRPERGPFIEEFRSRIPGYMLRHAVKAGMTGWAQVHGLRGQSSLEERLRYDLEYIDRWSLWLDLEILGRTAVHVLRGENAY